MLHSDNLSQTSKHTHQTSPNWNTSKLQTIICHVIFFLKFITIVYMCEHVYYRPCGMVSPPQHGLQGSNSSYQPYMATTFTYWTILQSIPIKTHHTIQLFEAYSLFLSNTLSESYTKSHSILGTLITPKKHCTIDINHFPPLQNLQQS